MILKRSAALINEHWESIYGRQGGSGFTTQPIENDLQNLVIHLFMRTGADIDLLRNLLVH